MSTLFVLLLIIVGISKINANCCTCCFPGQQPICQTPGINLPSCDECTSNFCTQHVKGCQGRYVCDVTCKSDSSTTSTKAKSSSTQTSSWNTYYYVRKTSNEKRSDYIKCETSTSTSVITEPRTISTRRRTLSTRDKRATIYISTAIRKNATIISSTSNTGIIVYTTSSTTKGSTSLATLRSANMSKSSRTTEKYTRSSFTTNKSTTTYASMSTTKISSPTSTKSTTTIASSNTMENATQTSSTINKRSIKQAIFNTTENNSINLSSTALKIQSYVTSFSTETTTVVSTKTTEQIFITTHSVTISTDMYTSSKLIKSREQNGSGLILIFSLSIAVSLLSCLLIALLVYKLCNKEILEEEEDEEQRQLSTPYHIINSTSNTESTMSSSQWKRTSF
ncbi:unnamed protein product [Rotaria magnacalcarata]|uniref:Uncharacterized protein n=1 Tax=Rotaria magnacalcarata TaxID=392030 RepID=A0A816P4P3_9BILA|nr:unnamed protein product [Rotaria magnacalcarata]